MIYLLHFDEPYKHARHYIGYTDNLERRWATHGTAKGARLLHVVAQAGIGWQLAALWRGTRDDERRLKNWKSSSKLCPVCTTNAHRASFLERLPIDEYIAGLIPKRPLP